MPESRAAVPDYTHYAYRVLWSARDREFVGLCAEFPSLSWLAGTQDEALHGVRDIVRETIDDMASSGEVVPQPLSERRFSGNFVVRVPPELHARLVREAAEQHVSLNALASERLAQSA